MSKPRFPNRQRVRTAATAALLLAVACSAYALWAIRSAWRAGTPAVVGGGTPPAVGANTPLADVAIVLGASAWGTEPSPALAERLAPAAALYQAGKVKHLILTGGVDAGGTLSEAEVGARYVERIYGIPRQAVALEDRSTSTALNLRNARAIMEARGWRTAVVVTHGYHLRRAVLLARDVGIQAVGLGTESRVLILPPLVLLNLPPLPWLTRAWPKRPQPAPPGKGRPPR